MSEPPDAASRVGGRPSPDDLEKDLESLMNEESERRNMGSPHMASSAPELAASELPQDAAHPPPAKRLRGAQLLLQPQYRVDFIYMSCSIILNCHIYI